MAEPARRLDDSEREHQVYDTGPTAPSNPRPNLKALEGGGETAPPKSGHLREAGNEKKPSREEISEAEESASEPQPQHENQVGRGYQPGKPSKNRFSIRGRLTKRRAAFGGGILGIIISIIVFFFVSGPLEFVHLSQTLQKNFFHSEFTAQIRNKGLFRYARTGAVEETRLGVVGSKVYGRTLSQLKDQGIEFQRNARGVPDSMTIDPSKNDAYKDLSAADQRTSILRDYQITDESILSKSGGIFKINLDNTTLKGINFVKATAKTAIGSLGNGKIETGLSIRYVREAWDIPSLFHPLKLAASVAKNKITGGTKGAADQAEEERLATEEAIVADSPEVVPDKAQLKDAIDKSQSFLTSALIATAGMCAIRAAANSAVAVNRAVIVLPSTVQAADKIAIGSQVQSGQDFDTTELGAVHDSFTDKSGRSIWQAQALQATEGLNNPSGPNLPSKYAQAFSDKTTADNVRNYIKITDPIFHKDITDAACSKVGQALQFVTAAILLIVNLPDGETGSFAVWAGEQAATAAAFGGITYAIVHFGTQLLSGDAVPAVLNGPMGGNLMAYGAREMSNVGARSMGGIALSGTNKSVLSAADQKRYDQQFDSEPVAQRIFDAGDSRSVISKLIDNVNPNPQNLATSIGNMFTHFGSFFSHSFASLSPHAMAAGGSYDWGFPKYGIPDSVAENPAYEDPYANGDEVAKMLDGAGCDTNQDCSWRSRAMACFGVDINKDSGVWSVVAQKDVNPDSDEYAAGNCSDSSDSWHRLMLFVTDSRLMDAIACQQSSDDQSCTNLAAEDDGNAPPTQSTGTGQLPTGTSKQLAQQLLQYISSGKIKCGSAAGGTGAANCQDIQNTAHGVPVGGNCAVNAITPHLLGLILGLVRDDGWTLGISAMCSNHHVEGDGPYAGHTYGSAADFSIQNSSSGAAAAADQKFVNDAAALLSSTGGSFGQIQCHPDYPALDNSIFTTFDDTCNHQHIRAAP